MQKNFLGPHEIIGVEEPLIAEGKVLVAMHDNGDNVLGAAFGWELLRELAPKLVYSAAVAEHRATGADVAGAVPIVFNAKSARIRKAPGEDASVIFQINDQIALAFPIGPMMATVLRDGLQKALDQGNWPGGTVN